MSFQGSLDTVGLEDVFQLFSFSRKSGALRLTKEEDQGAVYFHEGEIYYATTNPVEGVGKGLVNAGVVASEDWKSVLARTRNNDLSQGKALIEQDGVDAALVEAFVRERVEDAVFKLLQWETGDFALQDEVHPLGPVFVFSCEPVLAEGRKRLDIWKDIKKTIPSTAMGVGLRRDVGEEVEEVVLSRDEWRVVATLTPGVNIEELSAALGDTEYATCRVLHRMLDRGVVELHSPEKLEVIRRLMASAQSLDTSADDEEDEEDPALQDVDDAVSEVVVEQAEVAPEAEPSEEAAPEVEAASTLTPEATEEADEFAIDGDLPAEQPVETDMHEEHAASVAEESFVSEEASSKVSLADLAAAAEDGDVPAHHSDGTWTEHPAPEHGHHEAPAEAEATAYEYQETQQQPEAYAHQQAYAEPAAGDAHGAAPAGSAAEGEAGPDPADGGEELDKGLILRLIAGVRSL